MAIKQGFEWVNLAALIMMKFFRRIAVLYLLIHSSTAMAQLFEPADKHATTETRQLFYSMQRLLNVGVIFGHHDDLAYGVGWRNEPGRSDVKSVTGSYPALYGWDLARIEHDSIHDINGIAFEQQKQFVKDVYARGGINTFCWHMDNPANGKTAWDTTQPQAVPSKVFAESPPNKVKLSVESWSFK